MAFDDVVSLPKTLRKQAVDTLVLAFQDDVIKRTLAPAVKNRAPLTRWVFEGVVRYCAVYGEVHATPNAEGVACWIAPGKSATSTWGSLRSWNMFPGPFVLAGSRVMRAFFEMQDFVNAQHKRLMHSPHWYLWALAVRPECQGQGHGGRLLAPMMARADRECLPCYLETQTEQNVAFYIRRGFVVAHQAHILDIPLWFMIREPDPSHAGMPR